MKQIDKVKGLWQASEIEISPPATFDEVQRFQNRYKLIIPEDLENYFLSLNGTGSSYDNNLFRFYSLQHFLPIGESLIKWGGIPNYRNIVKTLRQHEECFVFSDHSFHLFVYAIRLNKNRLGDNQIYIMQGADYEVIANSFSDFLELYLKDDPILASL